MCLCLSDIQLRFVQRVCFGETILKTVFPLIFCNRNEEASESDAFTVNGGDWASAFSHHRSDDTDSNDSWSRTDASSTTEVLFMHINNCLILE